MLRRFIAAALVCGFATTAAIADPRPRKWCGWFMRQELAVADTRFNRAAAWADFGSPADGPAVGVIVVWPHHVGIITERTEAGFIVKSGNDGGKVRERERSARGAIALRGGP